MEEYCYRTVISSVSFFEKIEEKEQKKECDVNESSSTNATYNE